MSRSKEELLKEIENMTEDEMNNFAFFALKVMDDRCDQYEKIICLMADYICKAQLDNKSLAEVINHFINKSSKIDIKYDREVLFNAIINK